MCKRPEPSESSLRPSWEVKAQNQLDKMNLPEKASLTPLQSDTVRKMEGTILSGDLTGMEKMIHSYKDKPDEAKPVLDVQVKDLTAAGLYADYHVDHVIGVDGKTGMLDIATNLGLKPGSTGSTKIEQEWMCIYTNPTAKSLGEHMLPADDKFRDIGPDLAFRAVSSQLAINLTERSDESCPPAEVEFATPKS